MVNNKTLGFENSSFLVEDTFLGCSFKVNVVNKGFCEQKPRTSGLSLSFQCGVYSIFNKGF